MDSHFWGNWRGPDSQSEEDWNNLTKARGGDELLWRLDWYTNGKRGWFIGRIERLWWRNNNNMGETHWELEKLRGVNNIQSCVSYLELRGAVRELVDVIDGKEFAGQNQFLLNELNYLESRRSRLDEIGD